MNIQTPIQHSDVGTRKVDTSRGTSNNILSRQWMARPADERFLSLTDLHLKVLARAERSAEAKLPSKRLSLVAPEAHTIADTHDLWIETPDGLKAPSHWAFSQLCTLAKAPAPYLRSKPTQLVVDMLADDFRFRREIEDVKLYYSDDEALAITGPDYGRIYDHEVTGAIRQIAGNGTGDTRWKVPGSLDWRTGAYNPNKPVTIDSTTLYASDRDVWIMLCDDKNPIEIGKLADGTPDLVSRGFIVTNSEVGKSAMKLMAFYFRAVCDNRILWGVENFEELSIRHTKAGPSRFIEEARPALNSFAEGSAKTLVEGVNRAKQAIIADTEEDALAWLRSRKFTQTRAKAILEIGETEEGRPVRSAWDMAQAITADARSAKNTDTRIDQEMIAKTLLDQAAR